MNIVVLGAGAVGGYFGGKLAQKGYPTTFYVRERRYKQLEERGLVVDSVNGSFSLKPTIVKNIEEIENPEVVLVALKNYHLEEALPQMDALVTKGAKVVPLLNGVEHLDLLISRYGLKNVIGGLCYVESTLNAAGDVVQTSPMQDVVIGALDDSQQGIVMELYDMMKSSGIDVVASNEILAEMWKKYIFLTSLSGITSSMRQPIGVATKDPVTAQFLADFVQELYDLAIARDVKLPEDTVEKTLTKLHGLSETMTSSMHRDLEKGLPLELDSLHGFLIKVGEETGVATPCLRAVYALLHPYKNGTNL
ncbi:ketopantoate reductase family protein [Salirhabdus sp. Marseille-P4669]|uniref:ketopantoate reductase family protein n=1 Tax=Salirhabdus sp. Marseille-P4669 TaxID=2042310 RepID=UPI00135747E4|nr:ketopantoate reductase family protein [Salirhabdus sp. Marseille-P4669]